MIVLNNNCEPTAWKENWTLSDLFLKKFILLDQHFPNSHHLNNHEVNDNQQYSSYVTPNKMIIKLIYINNFN